MTAEGGVEINEGRQRGSSTAKDHQQMRLEQSMCLLVVDAVRQLLVLR